MYELLKNTIFEKKHTRNLSYLIFDKHEEVEKNLL